MARYNNEYNNRNQRYEQGMEPNRRQEEWNQGGQGTHNRGQYNQGMQGGRYEREQYGNRSGDYRGQYDYEATPEYRQSRNEYGRQGWQGEEPGSWNRGMREEAGASHNQNYGNQGYDQEYGRQGNQSYGNRGSQNYDNQGSQNYGSQGQNYGRQNYSNQGYSNQGYGNQGYGNQGMQAGNASFEGTSSYGSNINRQTQVPDYGGTAGQSQDGYQSGGQWGGNQGGNQWNGGQWTRDQGNYGSRQELGAGYGQQYNRGRYDSNIGQAQNTFGEGPYRGRGPKGFHRSDDRIKEEVCERLSDHGYLDASEIEVDVKDGEVILKGTVQSRQDKRTAEDLAESLSGVADIQNQLRVQRQNESQGNKQSSQNASSSAGRQQSGSNANGNAQSQQTQAKSTSTEETSSKNTKK